MLLSFIKKALILLNVPNLFRVLSQKNVNLIIWLGDSITARNWRTLTSGLTLSVSGTTCTCTLTAHGMYKSILFRYVDRGESGLMGTYLVSSWISANAFTFTVPAGTPASPTIGVTAAVLCSNKKGDDGFLNYANALSGQKFIEMMNFGVPGDATSHVIARLPEVLAFLQASNASRVILLIGTNDARNGITVSTYSTNLSNIVNPILNIGVRVDLCTVPPCSATPNVGTVASMTQLILGYNKIIKNLVRSDPRFGIYHLYAALVDPTSTTGAWLPGMAAADNVHFAPLGALTAGRVVSTANTNQLADVSDAIASMADSYVINSANTQLLANPLMQGNSGILSGATGVAADIWTVTATSASSCVASVVARADGIGNDQYGVMTASSASSRMRFDSEDLHTRIVLGAKYVLMGFVSVDVGSNIGTMKFEFQTTTVANSVLVLYCGICDVGNGNATSSGESLPFRSEPFIIPDALASGTIRLDIFASGAGTVGAKLGRVKLEQVG